MASTITAGNSTNGLGVTSDNTGTLNIKTGTGAGTTAISIDASQIVTGTAGNLMLVSGTAQTASGSSVDFTGIPSWVKRITLILRGVSTAAAGTVRIRVGTSSGLVTTGYSTTITGITSTPTVSVSAITDGLGGSGTGSGTTSIVGQIVISLIDTNLWVSTGNYSRVNDDTLSTFNGSIALAGTLDRISLVATTSTFDAGTINILYE